MDLKPLPFHSGLEQYQNQAQELFEAWRVGDANAIQIFGTRHPRFLDDRIPWLPKNLTDSEIRGAALEPADAQLAVARVYDFRDWSALVEYVDAISREGSVFQFESAVEAVIGGDETGLKALLQANPELVRARSARVTHFDPPRHRATLLHYVAANGV